MKKSDYIWCDRKRTIFGLPISFTVYKLTNEKLIIKTGIFTIHEEEIRLYRILDFTVEKNICERIFGVGKIELHTADRSTPMFVMKGVKNVEKVKEMISKEVEEERERKNITSREFFSDEAEEN